MLTHTSTECRTNSFGCVAQCFHHQKLFVCVFVEWSFHFKVTNCNVDSSSPALFFLYFIFFSGYIICSFFSKYNVKIDWLMLYVYMSTEQLQYNNRKSPSKNYLSPNTFAWIEKKICWRVLVASILLPNPHLSLLALPKSNKIFLVEFWPYTQ